ncbi:MULTISPECIES: three-helix bundle dimerization domain-containing protein [unclassified Streptomyces]|uniref:three-helix bundle dimerization domain-containing protein n=1 Tax=unclassified Streptomyces TaxID=2593676 RepID=UPI00331CD2E9
MSTPLPPLLPDERLAAGAARLASRYAGRFAPETVLGLLADSYTRLAEHARIRTHLVVLAERLTAERLDALARTRASRAPSGCGCCSCAATTPAAPRWPSPSSPTGRATPSPSPPRAPTPRTPSGRTSSRR